MGGRQDLIGTTVGHFRIEEVLGAGGMGVVYLATDTKLERQVALKLLPEEMARQEERRVRFLREARSAGQLVHPNIATVFEVGDVEGRLYLAMEYVEGTTLRTIIGRGALEVAEAARVAREMARALAKAHGAGIVHRDVKPDNVMVAEDGQVKVLDFGLAKLRYPDAASGSETQMESAETATNVTAEGRVLGTPGYMSPEQARGKEVDARSDLFSLGVVLYEMLSGRAAFGGDTPLDRMAAVTRDEAEPLEGVPAELSGLVGRCLEKDPEARIESAEAFLAALVVAVGSPSEERSGSDIASAVTAEANVSKPRRWLWAGAAVALAATLVAGLWWSRGADEAPAAAASGATPWSDPASVLACPPLDASGVPEPAGWLGAAAADIVCRRARVLMGGAAQRVLLPAELLDVPTKVVATLPEDLYGEPASRPRALKAAAERAQAWVDGSVQKGEQGFELELVVRTPGGEELGRSKGSGRYLHQAVREAMEPLLGAGVLLEVDALDAETAQWARTRSPRAAVAALELDIASALFIGQTPVEECDHVDRFEGDFDDYAPIAALCTEVRKGPAQVRPFPVNDSSPAAFAWSAPMALRYDRNIDVAALADRAQRLLDGEKSRVGRGALGVANVAIALAAGKPGRMLSFAAVQDDPRHFWVWQLASGTSMRQKGGEIANRAFQLWTPEQPDAWNIATFADPSAPLEHKIRFGERAVALSPDMPLFAQNLADHLFLAGRSEDVRSLAAGLGRGGPPQRLSAEALLARLESNEGKFDKSLERSMAANQKLEIITRLWWGDIPLVDESLSMGLVLGRVHEVADQLAERFVLSDPPRLYGHGEYTSYQATLLCLHASKPVAKRCVARLYELMAADFFKAGHTNLVLDMLKGLRLYLDGDVEGMVRKWRGLPAPLRGWEMRARILASVGRDDLAEQIDDATPVGHSVVHGAAIADVRRALRAEKKGDHAEARRLAQKLVDAWSDADTDVPAVAEMRELLGRLP